MTLHPLPAALPQGEHILWQGAPGWRALARGALHLRGLALYCGALVASVGISALFRGAPLIEAAQHTGMAALLATVPLAVGLIYSWLAARATTYTITNRRVMMRVGTALTITINLPYAQIESAGLRMNRDGTGDIVLTLTKGGNGLGWLVLWPHNRPWRFGRPQPMLRGLTDAPAAGKILSDALNASISAQINAAQVSSVVDTREVVESGGRNHGATTVAA